MTVFFDVPGLLAVAQKATGDETAADDLGVLFAAVGRHVANMMETDVYYTHHLKAAALLQTLARLPCLETHNELFAWAVAVAFLTNNGHRLDYTTDDAITLVAGVASGRIGVKRTAWTLRQWTVAHA